MAYKIKIQNSRGEWYQMFSDNEVPKAFLEVMKQQNATFHNDGTFECVATEIQPIIDTIEEYIKEKQKFFNSSVALKNRLKKRKEEMNHGIYKAVPNSLFDLTNDFVPYTRKFKSGFEENPTWRIIELHGTEWMLFMSFNFIKFIEDSIYRSDELEFKLNENSKLLIKGAKE